jgi:hypothetical protein
MPIVAGDYAMMPLKPLPEPITNRTNSPGWTSTATTALVASYTTTNMSPELPGWHSRRVQGHDRVRPVVRR